MTLRENVNAILHYEKFQDGTVKCIEDKIPFDIIEVWAWCIYETYLKFHQVNILFC